MARRSPKRAKSFSFDLLADWRPFADPPGPPIGLSRPWTYYGTCTLDGVTGALAFRDWEVGIAIGSAAVRELGVYERIAIQQAGDKGVPGAEGMPRPKGITYGWSTPVSRKP